MRLKTMFLVSLAIVALALATTMTASDIYLIVMGVSTCSQILSANVQTLPSMLH